MTDKKYQVFVSSTFIDLVDERREIMQSLLELGCIPAGMELFPASDESQFSLIKRVIDECDYYILVIGNRYGSTSQSGISYTEMEFDYAKSIGVPIIAFLHESPGKISFSSSDTDPGKIAKLNLFRKKTETNLVKYYSSPSDLGSKVLRSLVILYYKTPRPGWIRADSALRELANSRIAEMDAEIQLLREKLTIANNSAPHGSEVLSSGKEKTVLVMGEKDRGFYEIRISWDEIFKLIGPKMLSEGGEKEIFSVIERELPYYCRAEKDKESLLERSYLCHLDEPSKNSILTQFIALGYIKISDKKRTGKIIDKYWCLTQYGTKILMEISAIKSKSAQQMDASEPASPAR